MKRNLIVLLSISLCVVLAIWLYIFCTTPDNDLSEETIGDIRVHQDFNKLKYKFTIDHSVQLEGKTFYRSKQHNGLIVRKNNKSNKVSAITLFDDKVIQTNRDISIGNTKQDVIDAYGDTYQKSMINKHQTQFFYKDRENHIGMKFVFKKNKVKRIELYGL